MSSCHVGLVYKFFVDLLKKNSNGELSSLPGLQEPPKIWHENFLISMQIWAKSGQFLHRLLGESEVNLLELNCLTLTALQCYEYQGLSLLLIVVVLIISVIISQTFSFS